MQKPSNNLITDFVSQSCKALFYGIAKRNGHALLYPELRIFGQYSQNQILLLAPKCPKHSETTMHSSKGETIVRFLVSTAKNNSMGTSMFGTQKESSDFPAGSECSKHMLAPSVSVMPSQICMYVISVHWWVQIKKVMKIRREKLNEHVPDVNCYISRNSFAFAWVPIEFTGPFL